MRICCHEALAHLSQCGLPVLPQCLGARAGAPYPRRLADLVPLLLADGRPNRLASAAVSLLICGAVLFYIGIVVLTLALCKAAKRGDRPESNQ